MINIEAFSYALKATWIRRLITDNCKWQDYILKDVNLEKLTAVDTKYAEEIMKKIDNPFWKDVLTGFIKTNKNTKLEEGSSHILKTPIFYNSNICIDKKYVFWKDWYNKGIRFINDLVKENEEFYNQDELVAKYNITTNYLHYQGIIKSTKIYLNSHKITLTTNIEGPFIPKHLKPILQQKTGTQSIYNILNKNSETPTGMLSWNKKYTLSNEDWKKIFIYPFTINKYPAIQWFQSCINHNILVTNSYLFKIKLRNNPDCYYCLSQEETITHLFWHCEKIQQFLKSLENWLKLQNIECDINEESFILGINKNKAFPEILSFILLYAKYYIYTTRCNKQNLFLGIFKAKLFLMYKIHLEISISNDKLNKFVEKWNPYQNLINSISP